MIFTKDAAKLVASQTADPGVTSSIPDQFHPFIEIDHELFSEISTVNLLPLIQERFMSELYKRKYVHKVLVNRLVKLAQEKVWLGELTFSI